MRKSRSASWDRPSSLPYDALLLVSFGGPERRDDVIPFLKNVLRGKPVSPERMREIADRYDYFDGVSPINMQNRALLAAIVDELRSAELPLNVYWGNRNWHPLLEDTVRQMADDGVRSALAFVTSAFGSYPGCRQYQEDIAQACESVGESAPKIEKLRLFYNHPEFIEASVERVRAALDSVAESRRDAARLIFTAHSIPVAMAESSPYVRQLQEACRLVAAGVGRDAWDLVYQSCGGGPRSTWLEPDIGDFLVQLRESGGAEDVVLVPISFVSEHMEVIYDLDVEIAELCRSLGLGMVRAAPVGTHPRFVRMIRELVVERLDPSQPRLALGDHGPSPDVCAADCCRLPRVVL